MHFANSVERRDSITITITRINTSETLLCTRPWRAQLSLTTASARPTPTTVSLRTTAATGRPTPPTSSRLRPATPLASTGPRVTRNHSPTTVLVSSAVMFGSIISLYLQARPAIPPVCTMPVEQPTRRDMAASMSLRQHLPLCQVSEVCLHLRYYYSSILIPDYNIQSLEAPSAAGQDQSITVR